MAENTTQPPVRVSGVERSHPALRRLARACIALARWQRATAEPRPDTTSPAPRIGEIGPHDRSQDQRHD